MNFIYKLRRTPSWAFSLDEINEIWDREPFSPWNEFDLTDNEVETINKLFNEDKTTNKTRDGFKKFVLDYLEKKNPKQENNGLDLWEEIVEAPVVEETIAEENKQDKTEDLMKTFINSQSSVWNYSAITSFLKWKISEVWKDFDKEKLSNLYNEIWNNENIKVEDKVEIVAWVQEQALLKVDELNAKIEELQAELSKFNGFLTSWIEFAKKEIEKSWRKEIEASTHKFMKTETKAIDIFNKDEIDKRFVEERITYAISKKEIEKAIKNWEEVKWARQITNSHYHIKRI